MKYLKKIKGDASFRKFFRKKIKNYSSIIVFCKKEKIKNLLVYDAINKILNKNKILAPQLYKEKFNENYIEIQDLGDETIFKVLNKKTNDKFFYFRKIINLLNKIQSIPNKSVKNFKNKKYIIPKYKGDILIKEANLFCEWYVKKNLPKKKRLKFKKNFKKILKKLVLSLKLKNNVFVHRDFHVSNLILVNNQIAVIDSQDALIGNRAYDLASLIDDVRFRTSITVKKKIYKYYLKNVSKSERQNFKNDFEILSILRNLKIIGIFTRLAVRDGKYKYLKLVPYAWNLIASRIHTNKIFLELKYLIDENFKNKLNEN